MLAAALVAASVSACGAEDRGAEPTPHGTEPPPATCEQAPVMGNGDAFSYPQTLDELVADADVVVDARIVGESGAPEQNGQRQPMAVEVEEVIRGEAAEQITVYRGQTRTQVTGTDDTFVGSWDLEPWFCPGERYVLLLDRLPEGGYMALTRQGALRTEPPPVGRAPTELVAALRALDPDALRAEVRAAAARVAG